jgi:hypothetical protein
MKAYADVKVYLPSFLTWTLMELNCQLHALAAYASAPVHIK